MNIENANPINFSLQETYDNPALVTDFYEFTMANSFFRLGLKDTILVFDMFFRKNPSPKGEERGYSISSGQEQLTKFLLSYHFDERACEWLLYKGMDPDFVKYLSTYKWKGTMYAMPEGCVAYPNEQMVRIRCDLVGAILIETYLLQTMNFNTMIATQASRIVRAAGGSGVMEFAGRRAPGESASIYGARAAIIGGCTGTANCISEILFGDPVTAVGTIAHAWIEFFPTEWDAFKAFADLNPQSVSLLIDTYNIFESGAINTIKVDDYLIAKYPDDTSKRVKSVRIDSGDLASASKRLRKIFDEAGKPYIKIVASNDLTEATIRSMMTEQDAKIDSFGVGTNLMAGAECPVLGGVYKLVAVLESDGTYTPKMKCSDTLAKAIIPGYKTVYRLYNKEGIGYMDLIAMEDEVIEVGKPIKVYTTDLTDSQKEYVIVPERIEELLVPYIVDGELVREMPSILQIQSYVKNQLDNTVWAEELRSQYAHRHWVDMTEKVYKTRTDMYKKLHG